MRIAGSTATFIAILFVSMAGSANADWPMAGANHERTSWVAEEVRGSLKPVWYKVVEPYIPQKVQLIGANGMLYISSARGLYALDAQTGQTNWVYATEMPLGHSPTYSGGVLYVGGLDRRLHAINADTGARLWTFEDANAGFTTNPLVVADKVYAGNRDGGLYAIHTAGPLVGELAWKYQTGGPVLFSPACKDGVVYFASNDMHAYALDSETGSLVWQSDKLPGAGFQSYWPVVYRDCLILAGSNNYRQTGPGLSTFTSTVELGEIFPDHATIPRGTYAGLQGTEPGDWVTGTRTIDASVSNAGSLPITQYFEAKPWRRTYFVLDRSTGDEVTYDFDGDGNAEYAPILWSGTTHSGTRHAPVVGGDGVLYQRNMYQSDEWIAGGSVSGWQIGTPFISVPHTSWRAVDEPSGVSCGGNLIYASLCCDRVLEAFDISKTLSESDRSWSYYSYNIFNVVPDYNDMWFGLDAGYPSLPGWTGVYGTRNGSYGNHTCEQNAPIPYNGMVYIHRSNCVLAFAPSGGAAQKLAMASKVVVENPAGGLTLSELTGRLDAEVLKMVAAGHLRPGYSSTGIFDQQNGRIGDYIIDYWSSPGDTIYILTRALPYMSPAVRSQAESYIQSEWSLRPPYQYTHTGWNTGAPRELFDTPPENVTAMAGSGPRTTSSYEFDYNSQNVWTFPPHGFYAMWKYARYFGNSAAIFNSAKSKLNPVPPDAALARFPYAHNAFIAGYLGYLELEKLAGQPESASIRSELNRLLALRVSNFDKDQPWGDVSKQYDRELNTERNFMYLVPELGQYLRQNAHSKMVEAIDEYSDVTPYWFVSRAEEGLREGGIKPYYHYHALFAAKAFIMQESREQLSKYIDVPACAVGDLFYIDNLVSAIEAGNRPRAVFVTVPEPAVGDAPFNVDFDASDSNDPDGTIVSYDWDFGDSSSDSGVTTSHLYTIAGVYDVTLAVVDNNGLSSSVSSKIIVTTNGDLPPIAAFDFTANGVVAPLQVDFDASASGDPYGSIVSYDWDFGDGTGGGTGVTISHTFVDAGVYTVTLTVTDDGGLTDMETAIITVEEPPPPIEIPGRLEAEDYRLGGEGIGYHDTTSGNSGNASQYTDNIDISSCADIGGTFNIGYIVAGEWAAYDVNIAQAGAHDVVARVSSAETSNKTLRLQLDGVDVPGGSVTFNTGGAGWGTYQDVLIADAELIAGRHDLRIVMDTGNFNINYLQFTYVGGGVNQPPQVNAGSDQFIRMPTDTVTLAGVVTDDGRPDPPAQVTCLWSKLSGPGNVTFVDAQAAATTATFSQSGLYVLQIDANDGEFGASDTVYVTVRPAPGTVMAIPGRIETEEYKAGGEGVGYHDTTGGNQGTATEFTDSVDVSYSGEGGYNIGFIAAGEWLAYDVTVAASGVYDITARVASDWAGTRTLRIKLDGVDVSGDITFTTAAGAGWDNYFDATVSGVQLEAGDYEMRIETDSDDFNFDYVEFIAKSGSADLNSDGVVDGRDLGVMTDWWLWTGTAGSVNADITADGTVNFGDYCVLAGECMSDWFAEPDGDIDADGDVDNNDVRLLCEQWLWAGAAGSIAQDMIADGSVDFLDFAFLSGQWSGGD